MNFFLKNAVSEILNKLIKNCLVDFSDFLLSANNTNLQLAVCVENNYNCDGKSGDGSSKPK